MRAYKFLDEAGRAPFTGAEWPVEEWVEADAAEPCHTGVHACRPADVSHWIAARMWHVELDGDVRETTHKVVARRGRLLGPVDGYDDAMRELREACAWRSRDRAVEALRADGDDALAGRFAAVTTLAELAALGGACDETTFAGRAGAYAADAAHFAANGLHPQAPFVAACLAGHLATGGTDDQDRFDAGFAAERDEQSQFLRHRLDLD